MAEYLGTSDAFDTSITDFSQRYADQNDRDYQEFINAVAGARRWPARGEPARREGEGPGDAVLLDAQHPRDLSLGLEGRVGYSCHTRWVG